ncbi:MAG: NAD(P)-binding protein [Actinomycetota bacterium]|nr:NAD(P)-binding protein [Actinomycetota bacterium]
MANIRFVLDGREVDVAEGTTILDAARQHGVDIPTLCHDPRLKPYAACRICLVEVEGARSPISACAKQVSENMRVSTMTGKLSTLRRVCLELLASDHYGDCVAPCKLACPAGIDIQGQIALIANGQYEEALKLIKESNPLPSVCGRVCPRFCEQSCRRNLVDEPVSINALKRFVADLDMANGPFAPQAAPASGKKVVVVGGGPSGLSAAYYLALQGHSVSLYEAAPALGGMLRYGIPEYRLPKKYLDKEIETITGLCEAVRLNTALGRDFSFESLKNDGFEAVFVALGAQASSRLHVEGEDAPGVLKGVDFLRDVARGRAVEVGKRVSVIGGGNTAMDAARVSLRLGVEEVMVLYRRSRDEMPAAAEEIEEAENEGAKFHFLTVPVRIVTENGRVVGIECVKMELGEVDVSGRRRPIPVAGSEFVIEADTVISAIGQTLDMPELSGSEAPALNPRGYIEVDEATMATSLEGVFSGGDAASGPATVAQAVGAGKRAARSIHQYLSGEQVTAPIQEFNVSKGALDEIDPSEFTSIKRIPRAKIPALSVAEREHNFREIAAGLSEKAALQEASRCLSCGCVDVFDCELRRLSTEYRVEAEKFDGEKHRLPIPDDHRYILRDNNKCILCGRCARICSEVMGVGAISFVNRGFDTVIKPTLGMPLSETSCESCGQCISTCPTGALTAKVFLPKPGPLATNDIPSVCTRCGINCSLDLRVRGDEIVEVTSRVGDSVNGGNLCRKGAFEYAYIHSPKRIATPLIRRNGVLEPADWAEALRLAADGLSEIKAEHGGNRLAVLASPVLTNEECYLAQKLARMALETNNIGNSANLTADDALGQYFGKDSSTSSFDDIDRCDLILVIGCDVCADYPIASLKIRDAAEKGTRLAIINSEATRLDKLAHTSLRVSRRMTVELFQMMLNYIFRYDLVDREFVDKRTLGIQTLERDIRPYSIENWTEAFWVKPAKLIKLIHLYIRAKNPLVIVDGDTIGRQSLDLINILALVTGNTAREGSGILALRAYGNAQGQLDMGISPRHLPSQGLVSDSSARRRMESLWEKRLPRHQGMGTAEILEALRTRRIRGLVVVGSAEHDINIDAFGKYNSFSVAIAPLLTDDISKADVILPGTTFAETDGTFTSSELRVQRLYEAISPVAGKHTWQVLSELSSALGYPMRYAEASAVFDEIVKAAPGYSDLAYDRIPRGGAKLPAYDDDSMFIFPRWMERMAQYAVRRDK